VLIEQNENIQSGRYTDAEKSLDAQIRKMEEQIADTQKELEQAKSDALADQTAAVESNIKATQTAITSIQAEIASLRGLTIGQVRTLLASTNRRIRELQTQLKDRLTEGERQTIEREIQSLQEKKAWLTPLVEPGMIEKTLAEKQENLAMQQALLLAYREIYIDLLTTGTIEGTTDRIADLEKDLALYQQIYLNLLDDYETILLMRMQDMPNVVQLAPAIASRQAIRPHIIRNTLLGGLALFVIVIVILFLVELVDDTIKSADQVNEQLKLQVIGCVTKIRQRSKMANVYEYPHSQAAEAFRTLRTNLEFQNTERPTKLLLIASPNDSREKSNVAANLAITLAQGGKRVLLMDADLRHPQIHRLLGLANRKGLSDMIRDAAPFNQVASTWKDENLIVITSGDLPSNPADLLASDKMIHILKLVRGKADIVIIDSPSFLVADASILAARVDGVLLVIQAGQTSKATALFAVEQLKRAGARVLGVVLNRLSYSIS
jgi:capsular exopolysaccharide synthesis family protein